MHILGRIQVSQDPWEKVALLCLQQLMEDVSMNQKRIRALEMSVMALAEALGRTDFVAKQDLSEATATLQDLGDQISHWSHHSLDQSEQLVLAVRHLIATQSNAPAFQTHDEPTRLAS